MEKPKRKQIRLKGYDYSQNGIYFVTICAAGRANLFGYVESLLAPVGADIIRPQVKLSDTGRMLDDAIMNIDKIYPPYRTHKFIIMPNHVHILISIERVSIDDGAVPPLPIIIGQLKRGVSKLAGFPCWQRSFYEHVIRSESDYIQTWQYIEDNPSKWSEDEYYNK